MDIILGKERRRWSVVEKRAIVAETFEPGAVILEICRPKLLQASFTPGVNNIATSWDFHRRRRA